MTFKSEYYTTYYIICNIIALTASSSILLHSNDQSHKIVGSSVAQDAWKLPKFYRRTRNRPFPTLGSSNQFSVLTPKKFEYSYRAGETPKFRNGSQGVTANTLLWDISAEKETTANANLTDFWNNSEFVWEKSEPASRWVKYVDAEWCNTVLLA